LGKSCLGAMTFPPDLLTSDSVFLTLGTEIYPNQRGFACGSFAGRSF
jgi:hypothetical protein